MWPSWKSNFRTLDLQSDALLTAPWCLSWEQNSTDMYANNDWSACTSRKEIWVIWDIAGRAYECTAYNVSILFGSRRGLVPRQDFFYCTSFLFCGFCFVRLLKRPGYRSRLRITRFRDRVPLEAEFSLMIVRRFITQSRSLSSFRRLDIT